MQNDVKNNYTYSNGQVQIMDYHGNHSQSHHSTSMIQMASHHQPSSMYMGGHPTQPTSIPMQHQQITDFSAAPIPSNYKSGSTRNRSACTFFFNRFWENFLATIGLNLEETLKNFTFFISGSDLIREN